MRLFLSEIDCFFLSYDEPNAEENFSYLVSIAPWAKRIKGIKGWDAAHKAAAQESETEMFVTVDADTQPYRDFFDLDLNVTKELDGCALSWNSINKINGLVYGNGGLKIWPKKMVLDMKTHENADDVDQAVEFCWNPRYVQFQNIYSTTSPNGSPEQAWRAGFREGVKMTLDRGKRVNPERIISTIWPGNLKRLLIWCSVGTDIENGNWAIIGAIQGFWYSTCNTEFSHSMISDIEWLKEQFKIKKNMNINPFIDEIAARVGIRIPVFSPYESKFVKDWILDKPRESNNPLLKEKEAL